jgi:hypothetical protein
MGGVDMRSYSAVTRQRRLEAIGRIVRAECQASGSPKDPEFGTIFTFPVTDNDAARRRPGGDAAHVPLQPTLRTGTEALVAGALAWLAPHWALAVPSDRSETRCTASGTR